MGTFSASGAVNTMRVRSTLLAVVASVALAMAPSAMAAPNTGPSTAVEIAAGVPFSGDWAGTPRQHISDCCDYWHFYRPSFSLRTGDELQLAIDNTQNQDLYICLISPTDEFGAAETLGRECDHTQYVYVERGAMARKTVPYSRSLPNGFLGVMGFDSSSPSGRYTITIERVITRVNIGLVAPRRLGRTFTITSALRYGDNTAVADGISASLQFRPMLRGKRTSFKTIARAKSAGSAARFKAQLPKRRPKSGHIRACVEQPGGAKTRCTRAFRVRVR